MAVITKPVLLDETGQDIVDALEALSTTRSYTELTNKPKINNVELTGNITSAQLTIQPTLVSGTNIKTINNVSLLGSGNITVGDTSSLETRVTNLENGKEPMLTAGKLAAVTSGITTEKVATYDGYAATINTLSNRVTTVDNRITSEINGLNSSVSVGAGKAISGIAISAGKLVAASTTDINVPTNNNQLVNGAGYQTAAQVNTAVSTGISQRLTGNVVLHTEGSNLTYNGDTVTLTTTYKDLGTSATNTKTETIHLANSTTAGLMSPSDVNTIASNTARISALEGTTNRILYVVNSELTTIGTYTNAFYIKGIVYSITTATPGALVITKHNGAVPEPTYQGDANDNVIIDGITYHFDMAQHMGSRAATQSNINQFALNEGFVAPFRGVAIVVDTNYHIWHYYSTVESGQVIGWKDDGQDTVSTFTNSSPGVIQGAATDGKVYAENDGTGSVYGWSALKDRVTVVENRPTNVMTFTSGTTLPASGQIGQIFVNTSTNKVYIYNGTSFEAMNTYQ